jgi:hypothetical protein
MSIDLGTLILRVFSGLVIAAHGAQTLFLASTSAMRSAS